MTDYEVVEKIKHQLITEEDSPQWLINRYCRIMLERVEHGQKQNY